LPSRDADLTAGEEWDFDAVQQLILADLTIDGTRRQVLMQANKNGFFCVLDRWTGKLIFANTFVKINWASGIDANTGRPIENAGIRYDQIKSPGEQSRGDGHVGAAAREHEMDRVLVIFGTPLTYLESRLLRLRVLLAAERIQPNVSA